MTGRVQKEEDVILISNINDAMKQYQKTIDSFSKQLNVIYAPQLINQTSLVSDVLAASMSTFAHAIAPLSASSQVALSSTLIAEQIMKPFTDMQKQILNSFGYTHSDNYSVIREQYKALNDSIQELAKTAASLTFSNSLVLTQERMNERLHAPFKQFAENFSSNLASADFSHLFEGMTVQDNYVEIDEEDYEKISPLIESTEPLVSDADEVTHKKRVTLTWFINNLLPVIVSLIFTTLYNQYCRRIDSIEAAKNQMKEEVYQAQMLEATHSHTESINSLTIAINDFLEYSKLQQQDAEPPESSPLAPASQADALATPECALSSAEKSEDPGTSQSPD